jgi:lysophospholipase L1-like esterase
LNKFWYSHYQEARLCLQYLNYPTKIYSTDSAFAALKTNGSITAWGDSGSGGTGAPSGNGYTKIYSTGSAFAAVKADGTITAWGDPGSGGLTPTSD